MIPIFPDMQMQLRTYLSTNAVWHLGSGTPHYQHGWPCGVWAPGRPEFKHHYTWSELMQHGCIPKNLILIGVQSGREEEVGI